MLLKIAVPRAIATLSDSQFEICVVFVVTFTPTQLHGFLFSVVSLN